MRFHNGAKVGIHTDLINDGNLNPQDNTVSFVEFHSNNEDRAVLGEKRPVFYNVDIITVNGNLSLENSLGITNDLNFIEGKVITPKNNRSISLDFIKHNLYVGEDDAHHVAGYASVENYKRQFSFPIGDDDRLRPMILPQQGTNTYFKGAYFFENPNTPSTFSTIFDTKNRPNIIKNISNQEFWDLDGATPTTVTLTWDSQSNIFVLAEKLKNLRVVGWNSTTNKWDDLGNTAVRGNTDNGAITSKTFVPNDYTIITIGTTEGISNEFCNANYLISPNDDNINETLVIDCLKYYPPGNELSVYNRWGILVFRIKNYNDTWNGVSEGRSTFIEKDGLPVGTYYYIFKYEENNITKIKKGWVYVNR